MMPLLIGTRCITESGENANPISDDQVASFQLFQTVAQSAHRAVKKAKPYF